MSTQKIKNSKNNRNSLPLLDLWQLICLFRKPTRIGYQIIFLTFPEKKYAERLQNKSTLPPKFTGRITHLIVKAPFSRPLLSLLAHIKDSTIIRSVFLFGGRESIKRIKEHKKSCCLLLSTS